MIHPLIAKPEKAQNRWFDRQIEMQKTVWKKHFPKAGEKFFAYGLEKPGFLKASLLEPLTDAVLGDRCTSKLFPMIPHKPSNVLMIAQPDHGARVIGVGITLKGPVDANAFKALIDFYGGEDEAGLCFIRILPYRENPEVIDYLHPEGAWCVMSKWVRTGKHFARLRAPN